MEKINMNIKPGLVCLIAIVGVYVRFQVCAVCVCVCVCQPRTML